MKVSALYCHPVKSMRGIPMSEARISPMGMDHDRRYAVIQESTGRTLTAREHPQLLSVIPELHDSGNLSSLTYEQDGQSIDLPDHMGNDYDDRYTVWGDVISAIDAGQEAADFISDIIGKKARLVKVGEKSIRQADLTNVPHTFADLMPLLITTTESLDELNKSIDPKVPMTRFRPNIVVSGTNAPYVEDKWDQITVGDIAIEITFGCSRCVMPEYNDAGVKDKSFPVTTAMKAHRRGDDKRLYFGQNAEPKASGTVKIGDIVTINKSRDAQRLNDDGKAFYQK